VLLKYVDGSPVGEAYEQNGGGMATWDARYRTTADITELADRGDPDDEDDDE
jgi:hypothetical protein